MFGSKFNTAKCETTCRLCVGRIKLLRNKKQVQLKQSQRDIAEQLRNGKQEFARIRVEGVIREKLLLQAYEILELYLELLTVRTQLITKTKELPRDMMEAVSSIIYAAQRINDLPELATLRQLFASKYGKEYATEASADATTAKWQVNANLIRCLLVEAPQPEDKLAMLSEIAQEHGVEWDLAAAARDMGVMAPGGAVQAGAMPLPPLTSVTSGGPPASIAGGGGSVTSSYGGGGHGHHGGMAPVSMPGYGSGAGPGQPASTAAHPQYANAQQAAAAAQHAAAQAHAAAEYAAQWAGMDSQQQHPGQQQQGNGPPPPPGWLVQPAAPSGLPPGPPASGGFPANPSSDVAIGRTTPSPPPHDDGEPRPGGGGGGGFVMKSNEEIQRAYDAALGPPSKGAPAAPPAPPPRHDPAQLPSPPTASAQVAPPQVEDEYDELTRRLEALKRS